MTTVVFPRSADTPTFLALSGIGKRFGGTIALHAIDWSIALGEVHCLVGENGSGKSTMIKIPVAFMPRSRRHDNNRWRRTH